jgi:chaperonin GroEL
MVQRIDKSLLPDLLDDGGVIARRIIELADRDEDVGAMMVRHLMWRMHERYGDAAVTAALIYQSIFSQGVRLILNGYNAMLLRKALDKGAQLVMDALAAQTQPVTSREQITCLAETLCPDGEIAQKLGEIFARIGENGQLEIKPGQGRDSQIEFINGMAWQSEFFLRSMILDRVNLKTELEEPAILVSNLIIADPYELAEWLSVVSQSGIKKLLLLAREISPDCLSILEAARREPESFDVIAVKLWETPERWELQDLAVLTGGWMFAREAGYSLKSVHLNELGRARGAWIERSRFGVIDGRGDPEIIQRHALAMLTALDRAGDDKAKRKLQTRIASFTGKSAIFWMGGSTQIETGERVKLAERTANTLRGALAGGVLPGGAIALLECQTALAGMAASADPDEVAAARIIAAALQTPINSLLANCGENPSGVKARLKQRGKGYGFEVHSRKIRKMADAGIFDVANSVKAAAYAGITAAALGLTIEVIVHPKKRKEAINT